MSEDGTASSLKQKPTRVPVGRDRQVTVEPGMPWPSAYRGSKYSVVSSRNFGDVAQWSHMGDVQAMTELPDGLRSALRELGKEDGYGSFRLTASREVLTKIPADRYAEAGQAVASRGYIPVYVGKLSGHFDFQDISNDPPRPGDVDEIRIWTGLPFRHGETWAVCSDDVLRWTWQDYYFESVFDHPELVAAYQHLRPRGGRIYVNEHGHVWGNVDQSALPEGVRDRFQRAFEQWRQNASNAERRLVTRRLERTTSDAVSDGLAPVHLGHVSQFDDGIVPKPAVEDKQYFVESAAEADQ